MLNCRRHIGPVRCRPYKTLLPRMKCFYYPFPTYYDNSKFGNVGNIDLESIDCDLLNFLLSQQKGIKMKQLSAKDFPTKDFPKRDFSTKDFSTRDFPPRDFPPKDFPKKNFKQRMFLVHLSRLSFFNRNDIYGNFCTQD